MNDVNRKRWHNMLVSALADRELAPEEKTYLEEMRKSLGMTSEEANRIAQECKGEKSTLLLPGTQEERIQTLHDILGILLADGVISRTEQRLLDAVAKKIGLSDDEMMNFIRDAKKSRSSGQHPEPPSTPDQPSRSGSTIHAATGMEMISIPASTFHYGVGAVGPTVYNEKVKAFVISRFPVTNQVWRRFETATGHQGRVDFGPRFSGPNQPVVGVSFADAGAFCQWAGLSLPTEPEWEYAARGNEQRTYPWGDEHPDHTRCTFGRNFLDEKSPTTSPVGSLPRGASLFGVEDLIGGAAEWCIPHPNFRNTRKPTRGGHWLSGVYALHTCYHDMIDPDTRNNRVGFRVVDRSSQPATRAK